jgi:hypothetical protein
MLLAARTRVKFYDALIAIRSSRQTRNSANAVSSWHTHTGKFLFVAIATSIVDIFRKTGETHQQERDIVFYEQSGSFGWEGAILRWPYKFEIPYVSLTARYRLQSVTMFVTSQQGRRLFEVHTFQKLFYERVSLHQCW